MNEAYFGVSDLLCNRTLRVARGREARLGPKVDLAIDTTELPRAVPGTNRMSRRRGLVVDSPESLRRRGRFVLTETSGIINSYC